MRDIPAFFVGVFSMALISINNLANVAGKWSLELVGWALIAAACLFLACWWYIWLLKNG